MLYKILCSKTPEKMEEYVTVHIQKGWKPIGGISVILIGDSLGFTQAIIKE